MSTVGKLITSAGVGAVPTTSLTGTLQAAQEPAHTGDVTNSAGSLALTIAANAVSLAKMATIATARFLGRNTAGTGDVESLTVAQVETLLIGLRTLHGTIPMAPAAGEFIGNTVSGAALGTGAAVSADQNRATPFVPGYDLTVDQASLSISSGAAGNAKVVLYESNSQGRPTTVLGETVDIDTTSAATVAGAFAAPIALLSGKKYWLGVRTSAAPTLRVVAAAGQAPLTWTNAATPVVEPVLLKSEAYAGAAATWVYAATQHSSLFPFLVLLRVA